MHELFLAVQTYGYLAVFLGSIFEGESFVFIGGILAHEGILTFAGITAAAFVGAICGDWGFFWLGRYKRDLITRHFPKVAQRINDATTHIHAHPRSYAFGMRFMYGFRTVMPLSIGVSRMPVRTFMFWNIAGALAWSFTMVSLGYFAGDLVEDLVGRLHLREVRMIVLVALIIFFFTMVYRGVAFAMRRTLEHTDDT